MKVTLKIFRFNLADKKEPHYDTFAVDAEESDRVLDCLNKVRWQLDSSLAYRMSCGHGICGSDALSINGTPALACQKLVKDYDYTRELLIEPLKYFAVIKDLIVDLTPFYQRIKAINPEASLKSVIVEGRERLQSVEERSRFDDALKCVLCGCCYSACPVMNEQDEDFIGPAAVLRAQRYISDSRTADQTERMHVMEKPHGIWACKSYYMCTLVCPKNIKVTEAILRTKKRIIRELHPKTT